MPLLSVRLALCLTLCSWSGVAAQETVRFGAWHAFCSPVSGCVMGATSGEGDMLAFVEPSNGDDHLILVLRDPAGEGTEFGIAFDGSASAFRIDAGEWHLADSAIGGVVRVAPDTARALSGPMMRRDRMNIVYRTENDHMRRITFSLNGYADTYRYMDDE